MTTERTRVLGPRVPGLVDDQIADLLNSDDDGSDGEDVRELGVPAFTPDIESLDPTLPDIPDEEEEEVDESDEDYEDPPPLPEEARDRGRPRNPRPRLQHRKVHSLESSLDQDNYEGYVMPPTRKDVEVLHTKANRAKNIQEKKLHWSNQPWQQSRAGRRPAVQQRNFEERTRTQRAQQADDPLKCFMLFFTVEIISEITSCTNTKIGLWRTSMTNEELHRLGMKQNLEPTYPEEIIAFFGLFYIRGLYKLNRWKKERIWHELYGLPFFTATMGKHRFCFLMR